MPRAARRRSRNRASGLARIAGEGRAHRGRRSRRWARGMRAGAEAPAEHRGAGSRHAVVEWSGRDKRDPARVAQHHDDPPHDVHRPALCAAGLAGRRQGLRAEDASGGRSGPRHPGSSAGRRVSQPWRGGGAGGCLPEQGRKAQGPADGARTPDPAAGRRGQDHEGDRRVARHYLQDRRVAPQSHHEEARHPPDRRAGALRHPPRPGSPLTARRPRRASIRNCVGGAFRSRNAMNCRYEFAGIPEYATGVEWARLETPNSELVRRGENMKLLKDLLVVIAATGVMGSAQAQTTPPDLNLGTLTPTDTIRTDFGVSGTSFADLFTFSIDSTNHIFTGSTTAFAPPGITGTSITGLQFVLKDSMGGVLFTGTSLTDTELSPGSFSMLVTGKADGLSGGGFRLAVASHNPEPAEWMMLLAGLVVVGFIARRKIGLVAG